MFLFVFRSISEPRSKGCCGFSGARPPLRALIAVVALGGVACALGGAALGALGLGGAPTSHLTAALLMIGELLIINIISRTFLVMLSKNLWNHHFY